MQHIYNLTEAHLDQPSVVTIGVFDGVHRGHQHLISQLVEEAHTSGRLAVVLTLFPHPDVVLRGLTGRYYLTTSEQKAALLGALGVDVVVTHPFNDEVRRMRAAAFVDQLCEHLRMSSLWVTADFAMGYQREGNFAYLTAQGTEKNFEVRQTNLVQADHNSATISSTDLRSALLDGQVEQAAAWLGRLYRVDGLVVKGDQRGRTIGFPTANLDIWAEQIIPATGVYACWAYLGDERFMAVTNIGYRPTFGGQDIRVEAHLLGFDRDIYGQTLGLEFVARLRGEQKFSGFEALVQQIHADVVKGSQVLTKYAEQEI
ncbi:MAG: bifunctional riboflavin kinase/FAD synthetase [Anaerolineae bacterium]|nr:bifunctional riboflavin kinase/FAD synthetase [Anaerolineae bacterium]